jgi:hypothetical protein
MTEVSPSGTDEERRVPGPWVIVLGMHRAGTSAITGALAALGMALPPDADLVRGQPDNPVHYESNALIALNDRILETMGGWWNAPPEDDPGREFSRAVDALTDEARSTLSRVFPGPGPNVWKDPRNCVLLPYWRRLVADPVVVVLIWRSPLAVAKSLSERDGSTIAHGVALWEHYNRQALEAVAGLPVYLTSNEALIRDPHTIVTAIAGWLDDIGIAPGSDGWNTEAAAQLVTPNLSHHGTNDLDGLLPSQIEVVERLRELDGPHAVMEKVHLGPPSLWTLDALAAERTLRMTTGRLVSLSEGNRKLSEAHDELIATYRSQIAISDDRLEHIQKLQQIADDRMVTIEKMGAEAQRLQEDVSRLQTENEALIDDRNVWRSKAEAAASDLRQLQSSSSWRLTAPLRAARDVIGKPDKPGGTTT